MNEKIRELAEQFRMDFSIDENSQDGIHWDSVDEFAELIVKECAQVCRDQPEIYALKADRDNCAIAIEQHFGIE